MIILEAADSYRGGTKIRGTSLRYDVPRFGTWSRHKAHRACYFSLVNQLSSGRSNNQTKASTGNFVRVRGSTLTVGESNKELFLREVVFVSSKVSPPDEKDYEDVARTKANTVRLALQYKFFYDSDSPDSYKESGGMRGDLGAVQVFETNG